MDPFPRSRPRRLFGALIALALAGGAGARGGPGAAVPNDDVDLRGLTIEELLEVEIEVASKRARPLRISPGIVTVLDRDEILASGARDLIDLLRTLPAFGFAADVEGVVGIGVRGVWAHEGKVLLLLDGQEMNERMFSTIPFGRHFPIEQIERIEVMRGPGSVIHGGYAELAVINVITASATGAREGARVAGRVGSMDSASEQSIDLSAHRSWGGNLELSAGISALRGLRSDRTYTDFAGSSFAMAGRSDLQPTLVNIGLRWRELRLRAIHDHYRTETRDGDDLVLPRADRMDFDTTILDAQLDLELSDGLRLQPRLNFKRQRPWRVVDPTSPIAYDNTVDRYSGGLTTYADLSKRAQLSVGFEGFTDRAELRDTAGEVGAEHFVEAGEERYHNAAAFAELLLDHPLANLTAGLRHEVNSQAGSSLVPRIGLTRSIERLHLKAFYNRAFRAPGVENILSGVEIEPERTSVFELAVTYELGREMMFTATGFDISIDNPIIYFYDELNDADTYRNFARTGSRGFELDWRIQAPWLRADLGYSFYSARGANRAEIYTVAGHPELLLGFPAHKLALRAQLRLEGVNMTLDPSAVWLSERYGFLHGDGQGGAALEAQPSLLLLDLFVNRRDLFAPGLDLGLGVHDLLDSGHTFIQPYDSGHAPIPGPSRELSLRLAYRL